VLDGFVRAREFSEVVASHLWLDLDRVENLAVVNSDNGTNHFWDNNHVSEVSLDDSRFFVGRGLLLGLTKLLDQTQGLSLEATIETPANAGLNDVEELLVAEIQELLKLDATVGKSSECPFFLELGGEMGVGSVSHGRYVECRLDVGGVA